MSGSERRPFARLVAAAALWSVLSGACPAFCGEVSEQQLTALKTSQRSLYSHGNWEEFFGAAQAYRRYWFAKAPDADLVVLESLALIKFCYYREALRLVVGLRTHFGSGGDELQERLRKLESLIPGIEALRISLSDRGGFGKGAVTGGNSRRWPTPDILPPEISPSAFRAKVVSKCDR